MQFFHQEQNKDANIHQVEVAVRKLYLTQPKISWTQNEVACNYIFLDLLLMLGFSRDSLSGFPGTNHLLNTSKAINPD